MDSMDAFLYLCFSNTFKGMREMVVYTQTLLTAMTTVWPLEMSRLILDYAGLFYFWTEEEMYEAEYQDYSAEEEAKKWMNAEVEHEALINAIGDE